MYKHIGTHKLKMYVKIYIYMADNMHDEYVTMYRTLCLCSIHSLRDLVHLMFFELARTTDAVPEVLNK